MKSQIVELPMDGLDIPRERVCKICHKTQPIERFFRHHLTKDGWRNECKSCMNVQGKAHRLTLQGKWTTAKKKASIRGLCFTITFERYKELMAYGCYYCRGMLLGIYGTNLDRINNEEGYTNENVVPCCPMCNRIKHTYLSVDEMLAVAKLLKEMRNRHYVK